MPMSVQILRNGEPRSLQYGWGWFHLGALLCMISDETGKQATYNDLDGYTFQSTRVEIDATDGEVFMVLPGDQIRAWR